MKINKKEAGNGPLFKKTMKCGGKVVVVKLVERSIPTPEVRGSNPVISKKIKVYCQLH